jgi:hypothetical protein
MGIYVFLAVGLVIVGAFLYFEAQRRDALAGVAAQLGMTFTGGLQRLPADLDNAGFYLFTQGAPECLNLMQGEHRGYRVALFGYGYDAPKGEEGSRDVPLGDAGQIERRLQTVLWVQTPGRPAGQTPAALDLSPTRGSLRRVAERYHLSPVILDHHPGFRDLYQLYGRDPEAVAGAFGRTVLDVLVADPGWFIEARGDQWLVYRIQERVAPDEMTAFLDRGLDLLQGILGTKARGG